MTVAVARELQKRKKKHESAVPLLLMQINALKLPAPVTEWRFHPTRMWRLDVAWPDYRVGVEVQGGGFVQGAHSRGPGMENDAEKNAEAILRGWRVFTATPRQIKKGQVAAWLERVFTMLPRTTTTTGAPKC